MLFLRGLARRALSTPRASRIASFNDNSCGSLKQKDTIILQPGEVISVCRCWKSAKFPLCDGSHKVLNSQHKSKLGPYVVKAADPVPEE
eukprot:TRINITY_DN9549_c0_g1_i1.p1 TRINITY_DN9549_c0_g1~~TRINITY_DN9549_c0_g1_i1.p1  ORF type:complete len:102 (-),score=37.33 TRINITY_DN9549_c0_g1_i1:59-325(-)